MARTNLKTVEEYVAIQPLATQTILNRVRAVIRKAVPKAEEVISYQIIGYKLQGKAILYLAGWKKHYSLYPANATLITEFKDDFAPYKVVKSTLQFPFNQPLPTKLIERIAKFRAKELAAKE